MQYRIEIPPGKSKVVRLVLTDHAAIPIRSPNSAKPSLAASEEADAFYAAVQHKGLTAEEKPRAASGVRRHAFGRRCTISSTCAWLYGDNTKSPPPKVRPSVCTSRLAGFERWAKVMSVPDKMGVSVVCRSGIWRFMSFPWRWWMLISPRTSLS